MLNRPVRYFWTRKQIKSEKKRRKLDGMRRKEPDSFIPPASIKWKYVKYQRRDEVDAGHVVNVVGLQFTLDAFLPTGFDARLEDVRVEEMLHRFRTQVDAQVFQLTRLDRFRFDGKK
jgi:hypothetical protein